MTINYSKPSKCNRWFFYSWDFPKNFPIDGVVREFGFRLMGVNIYWTYLNNYD